MHICLDAIQEMDSTVPDSENARCPTGVAFADYPAPRLSPSQSRDRNDFEIAIICALPLEASSVGALFDKQWDHQRYGKAPRPFKHLFNLRNWTSQCCFGAHAEHGKGCCRDRSSLPSF